MGKIEMIRGTPDGDWMLSLIRYGFIRRFLLGWRAKQLMGFVSRYELIATRGSVLNPVCSFHFNDKGMYDWLAIAIIKGGIGGKPLAKLLQDYPSGVCGNWAPNWRPMVAIALQKLRTVEQEKPPNMA